MARGAAMRSRALAVLLAVAGVLTAQQIEAVTRLPDSFGLPWYPTLAFDAENRLLFLAGMAESLYVFSEDSGRVFARVGPFGEVSQLFCDSRTGLVFGPTWDGAVVSYDWPAQRAGVRVGIGVDPAGAHWVAAAQLLYVAGTDGDLVAVDPATGAVLSRRQLWSGRASSTGFAAHDSTRFACYRSGDSTVCLLDAAGDSLLAWLQLPGRVGALATDAGRASIYCSSLDDSLVRIVDFESATAIDSVAVEHRFDFLAVDPATGFVYAGCKESLVVYEPGMRGVLSRFDSGRGSVRSCLFPPDRDSAVVVYDGMWSEGWVAVFDRGTAQVIAGWENWSWFSDLAYAPPSGRLYLGYGDGSVGRDAMTGRIGWLGSSEYRLRDIAVCPAARAVYCAPDETYGLVRFDEAAPALTRVFVPERYVSHIAANDSGTRLYVISDGGEAAVFDPRRDSAPRRTLELNRVACTGTGLGAFFVGSWDRTLTAVDCASDSIRFELSLAERPAVMSCFEATGMLYVLGERRTLTIVDGRLGRVVAEVDVGSRPMSVAVAPGDGLLYVVRSGRDRLLTLNAQTGEMVDSVRLSVQPVALVFDSLTGKLYVAAADSGLYVVDCGGASVPRSLPARVTPKASALLLFPDQGRLLCLSSHAASGVVTYVRCLDDSVMARLELPAEVFALRPGSRSDQVYALADEPSMLIRLSVCGRPAYEVVAGVSGPAGRASVVRGVLSLPARVSGRLVDAAGRLVRELHPGDNDLAGVAPGVYFVRERAVGGAAATAGRRRVVITR